MFEKASRLKLRFDTPKGQLTVEDLWDLPLVAPAGRSAVANLDDIAIGLNKQLKNGDDVSFVIKDRKSDSAVQLKFDIVKRIIDVRLAEDDARAKEQENAAKKKRLLAILADKQDEALRNMSAEDIQKMVAELS